MTILTIIALLAAVAVFAFLIAIVSTSWFPSRLARTERDKQRLQSAKAVNASRKDRGVDEIFREQTSLERSIADTAGELREIAREFCIESSEMLKKWVSAHMDDFVNEHPDRIIQLGARNIASLKRDVDHLKAGMLALVTQKLLHERDPARADAGPLEEAIGTETNEPRAAAIAESSAVDAELETSKRIDHKFAEIAGRLGEILALHDLALTNNQRWSRHKTTDRYVFNGAIMWNETMRSIYDEFLTVKSRYLEHLMRMPDLEKRSSRSKPKRSGVRLLGNIRATKSRRWITLVSCTRGNHSGEARRCAAGVGLFLSHHIDAIPMIVRRLGEQRRAALLIDQAQGVVGNRLQASREMLQGCCEIPLSIIAQTGFVIR